MKYIYRGFMVGIGIAVSHLIIGAVLLAACWSVIEPVMSNFGIQL